MTDTNMNSIEPQAVADVQTPVAGYAGFWKRLAAYIIDFVVIAVIFVIIGFFLAAFGSVDVEQDLATADFGSRIDWGSIVITWLYFALMESSAKQATLGKMALGIVVTDYQGGRISFLRATGRFFAKYLSALLLLIGFIMVAFTRRKQGLHDFIASTLVVNRR